MNDDLAAAFLASRNYNWVSEFDEMKIPVRIEDRLFFTIGLTKLSKDAQEFLHIIFTLPEKFYKLESIRNHFREKNWAHRRIDKTMTEIRRYLHVS